MEKQFSVLKLAVTVLILAFIANVALFGFRYFRNKNSSLVEKVADLAPRSDANIYSIESMRAVQVTAGEIKLEKKVAEFESHSVSIISYLSDGLKIYCLLSIPRKDKPENGYPVLIMNHGYIDPGSYSTAESYRSTFDFYALQGMIVIKPDYRGNGDSEGERDNPLNRIKYATDVLHLIQSVSSIPEANANNVVLWGHSMGGDVSLRVLEITNKIKGASLWAPVSAEYPESFLYFIRKNRPETLATTEAIINNAFKPEEFSSISPLDNLGYITSPLIIHHGTSDESVPFEWSVRLESRLQKTKVPFTFYQYDGDDHNFRKGARPEILKRDVEFFKKVTEVPQG